LKKIKPLFIILEEAYEWLLMPVGAATFCGCQGAGGPTGQEREAAMTLNQRNHTSGRDAAQLVQSPQGVQPLTTVPQVAYYDLRKSWRKVKRHLNDKELNAILVRDFNRFTYGGWRKQFKEGMYPCEFDSCHWTWRHKGRQPGFWRYAAHHACHWLVNFALKLAMLVEPSKQWRIITSNKHSTVWDGDKTVFEFNFQAFGIAPQECFELAREHELAPGAELKVGWSEHYAMELMRQIPRERRRAPTLYLYETPVGCAVKLYRGVYPMDLLCEFVWNCWKNGKRSFKPNEQLTVDLLLPFVDVGILVHINGMSMAEPVNFDESALYRLGELRFRHRRMRGYLAACWAVKHATSVQVTIERLQENEVWSLRPSDQELVFPFLTRLMDNKDDLKAIEEFAAKEPEKRGVLLKAARASRRRVERAERRGQRCAAA
jgi:hypothetical protein